MTSSGRSIRARWPWWGVAAGLVLAVLFAVGGFLQRSARSGGRWTRKIRRLGRGINPETPRGWVTQDRAGLRQLAR